MQKSISEYFKYLYTLERTGVKYDLKNITALLKALGNPHKGKKFVHIAGTNGKGATASYIASMLMEQGLKVGLFTSPHILKFNERIRINGKCIPNKYITDFLDANEKLIKKVRPSFFEVNTALAFKYFADKGVDIAIIEAGLGGRLDSTNVITPVLSIITQTAMDHMQFLGNTLKKIAIEKIGIVKPGIDVIVSDTNKSLRNVFRKNIDKQHLFFVDEYAKKIGIQNTKTGTQFKAKIKDSINEIASSLRSSQLTPGDYQLRNAITAILAVNKLTNGTISASAVKRGIEKVKINTGYRARLEYVKVDRMTYIFDISHNPDGIQSAINNLKPSPDILIFAIMEDKDYKKAVKIVASKFQRVIFTKPEYKRALNSDIMKNIAEKYNLDKTKQFDSVIKVRNALNMAKSETNGKGTVLIMGSFFLVSEAIRDLKLQKYFS